MYQRGDCHRGGIPKEVSVGIICTESRINGGFPKTVSDINISARNTTCEYR